MATKPKLAPAKDETTNLPATAEHAAALNGKWKIAKRITLPTLNPAVDVPYVLRVDSAIRVSKYIDPDPKKAKEKPADICDVTDMETGAVYLLLAATVVTKNLQESYPDGDYVGRIFAVQKLPKRPNKRYHDWNITEVTAAE